MRAMLKDQGFEGVVIRSQANLAWLTSGRYFVNQATDLGCADIIITPDEVVLVSDNIEADRLWKEEGAMTSCDRMLVGSWYNPWEKDAMIRQVSGGYRMVSDESLGDEFRRLRITLTTEEQQRYFALGMLAGSAVEEVARVFALGESEYRIAGRLACASLDRGMEPVVCLVGADERAFAFRHPLPTGKSVQEYALLVLSARKWGLHASVSRAVHFGSLPRTLADKHAAVLMVEAQYLAATRPGKTLGEIYALGQKAYADAGYPGEWEHHHQGGITGFRSREVKATPTETVRIAAGQAVAWNPTIQGTKAEDTVLVKPDGLDFLTATGNFPVQTVVANGVEYQRPSILTR